jgi:uncharacterized C2H2 Zn-finger protein
LVEETGVLDLSKSGTENPKTIQLAPIADESFNHTPNEIFDHPSILVEETGPIDLSKSGKENPKTLQFLNSTDTSNGSNCGKNTPNETSEQSFLVEETGPIDLSKPGKENPKTNQYLNTTETPNGSNSQKHENSDGEKLNIRFQCPYCASNYAFKRDLQAHVRKNHSEKHKTTDYTKTSYFGVKKNQWPHEEKTYK